MFILLLFCYSVIKSIFFAVNHNKRLKVVCGKPADWVFDGQQFVETPTVATTILVPAAAETITDVFANEEEREELENSNRFQEEQLVEGETISDKGEHF